MRAFPPGQWGELSMEFFPAPFDPPAPPFASLVFLWRGSSVLLAQIPDRGWTIPSGRVEPGETPLEAALRECHEEVGARVESLETIGYYRLGESRWSQVFNGIVVSEGEIPPGSESVEARWFTREEVPHHYSAWNPLIEAVFDHSYEQSARNGQTL